jgi:endoglucanase
MVHRLVSWTVALVFAAGCSSSGSGGRSDGAAGAGGAAAGAAGMGGGGAGGTSGSTGGTAAGAAGTGDPNVPTVTMSLWEYAIGPTTQLAPNMQLNNMSAKPFSLHDIEIRYWYTSDIGGAAGVTQTTQFQGSQGIIGDFNMSIVPVVPARPMADSYLSLDFSPVSASIDAGVYAGMLVYITRSDGGTYDQANDYSYNASASALTVTDHVTVYYKGALIYGIEP